MSVDWQRGGGGGTTEGDSFWFSFFNNIFVGIDFSVLPILVVIVGTCIDLIIRDRHIFMTFWAYATKKDASAVHGELSQQAPYKTEPEIIKKAKER